MQEIEIQSLAERNPGTRLCIVQDDILSNEHGLVYWSRLKESIWVAVDVGGCGSVVWSEHQQLMHAGGIGLNFSVAGLCIFGWLLFVYWYSSTAWHWCSVLHGECSSTEVELNLRCWKLICLVFLRLHVHVTAKQSTLCVIRIWKGRPLVQSLLPYLYLGMAFHLILWLVHLVLSYFPILYVQAIVKWLIDWWEWVETLFLFLHMYHVLLYSTI